VKAFDVGSVSPDLLAAARAAAAAVGSGLYGIDLKEVDGRYVVIEVNDNPTLAAGEEDRKAPLLYERIVRWLAGEWE
jgi:glutathione synthase/RimK-type ligase-like ATP-grasp enzyme